MTDSATKRPDDRRGAPKGRWGNVAHQRDEAVAAKVRQYAKMFPMHGEHFIAAKLGMHRETLRKYYAEDIHVGRADLIIGVASQVISRALDADAVDANTGQPVARGDLDAQKFILARMGGWTTKVELTGKDGGPIEQVDLSNLTPDQLREYGRLAAIARGLDPDEVVGGDPD